MPLVLIESPNKISKLRKILGNGYTIMASVGHIMDLSKKNLGIDIETFEATYKVNVDKEESGY
jgi:DNA topoisomerase-1